MRSRALFLAILGVSCAMCVSAQRAANSNAIYQQLRGLLPGGEVVTVSNLELHRDAAVFTFRSGGFAFFGEVNGKVTGAVYKGDGHLHITPPTPQERHNLSLLTHGEQFDEDFDSAVLRFTDGTAAELHKASSGKGDADQAYTHLAQEFKTFSREKLHTNFDLRLLADVLSPAAGGYFLAAIHGTKAPHLLFTLDPNGAPEVAPEEVSVMSWSDWGETYPLAFHLAKEYANSTANGNEHNASYKILNENLDISIERSGQLSGLATVDVRAEQDGVAVIPLSLYSEREASLRVSRVDTGKSEPLDFVQENKDNDPDFGVVLAQPLAKGATATFRVEYGGKNIVINMGNGNYYPIARENWYPSSSQGLGDYTNYHMLFHVPKGLQIVATGIKIGESNDGGITTTEWKTEAPLAVVGFSFGEFATKQAKFSDGQNSEMTVSAYANQHVPDFLSAAADSGQVGTLATTPMLANELSQGEAAAQIYTNFFGPLPFSHIALTQQSACNYGQSWPMLVFLPICGFFDSTQQHFLGLGGENLNKHMYWKMVTPHEVAHQWWGQTVGFRGYRDQWMSEGFADCSASIFLQATQPKSTQFLDFWKEERRILTEKNAFGFRPNDVGPVTMGFRLSSTKAGNIYGDLVYPKGAYILHMLRMMMWTQADGDARFKATMQDFVASHRMEAATTEDFKAAIEKHMSPQMDLDGNQRMDWFFNQYVYGTELPEYHLESQVTPSGDGASLHFKLTQSGVSPEFKMMVPIYLEFADGRISKLGAVKMVGATTTERTLQLQKLPGPAKRVSINYYYDVLGIEN
jgi:hypothetical protein